MKRKELIDIDLGNELTFNIFDHLTIDKPYWQEVAIAIFSGKYNIINILAERQSGKSFLSVNIAFIFCSIFKNFSVAYVTTTQTNAKHLVYDRREKKGVNSLTLKEYLPQGMIKFNGQDSTLNFTNGSQIELIGSLRSDSKRGLSPDMIIFDETAVIDPKLFYMISSVFNNAIVISSTTPNEGWFYDIYRKWKARSDVYTVELPESKINILSKQEKEIIISTYGETYYKREHELQWNAGSDSMYIYSDELLKLPEQQTNCNNMINANKDVLMAFDIGKDMHVAIVYQVINTNEISMIYIYDVLRRNNCMFTNLLDDLLPYFKYNCKLYLPHDSVTNLSSSTSQVNNYNNTIEWLNNKNKEADVNRLMRSTNKTSLIDKSRSAIKWTWFNSEASYLLQSMKSYRREHDQNLQIYKNVVHDWASHACDAYQYVVQSIYDRLTYNTEVKQNFKIFTETDKLDIVGQRRIERIERQEELLGVSIRSREKRLQARNRWRL